MKLYGTPPTRAIRVQWLLNELGVDCKVIGLNPLAPDPEYFTFMSDAVLQSMQCAGQSPLI